MQQFLETGNFSGTPTVHGHNSENLHPDKTEHLMLAHPEVHATQHALHLSGKK